MRISTRGRYGLRAMFELALRFGEGPILMSTVAKSQGLSRKHLHALLTALKSAGLVHSVRGPGGGFVLTRSPDQIRLNEILHALEGPISVVHCVLDKQACDRADRCAARRVWQQLSAAIESVLDNVTLEDMTAADRRACDRPRRKRQGRRLRSTGGRKATPLGIASRTRRQSRDKR